MWALYPDEDVLIFTCYDQTNLTGHHWYTIPSALLLLVCNLIARRHAHLMNVNHATAIILADSGMKDILVTTYGSVDKTKKLNGEKTTQLLIP